MKEFVYVTRKKDGVMLCVSMDDYKKNIDIFDFVKSLSTKEEEPVVFKEDEVDTVVVDVEVEPVVKKKTTRKKAAPKE